MFFSCSSSSFTAIVFSVAGGYTCLYMASSTDKHLPVPHDGAGQKKHIATDEDRGGYGDGQHCSYLTLAWAIN